MAKEDPQTLIQSAGTSPEPAPSQQPPEPAAPSPPEAGGLEGEVAALAQQLAELMLSNPQVAERIADVLEELGKGEASVAEGQGVMPGTPPGPGSMPGPGPVSAPAVPAAEDPVVRARLEEIERQLADYEVDRELASTGTRYGQLRQHFGDLLPEGLEEQALLQKVHAILTGKASPFDAALAMYLLEKATAGEGTMRDRILAAAAQGVQKPPAVEGRGGGVATGEGTPDVSKMSATQLMDYVKGALASRRGQPG